MLNSCLFASNQRASSSYELPLDSVGDNAQCPAPPALHNKRLRRIARARKVASSDGSTSTATVQGARRPLRATLKVASKVITGHVRNLSIGGVFFVSNLRLDFGTQTVVTIDFPKPCGRVQLPAVVRWVDSDGMGLQFGLLGAQQTFAIAGELTKQHPADALPARC